MEEEGSGKKWSDSVLSASTFPFDDPLKFSVKTSFWQYPLREFHGYYDSSAVPDESKFDALAFTKPLVSPYTQCLSHGGQGRAADGKNSVFSNDNGPLAREGLLKQDSKPTPYKVSTSDVLSLSMLQNSPHEVMLGLSVNGIKFSPTQILSKNMDLTGNFVASNNRESNVLLNAASKEVHQDKSRVDKGKEVNNSQSIRCKVLDPLVIAKSKMGAVGGILDGSIS